MDRDVEIEEKSLGLVGPGAVDRWLEGLETKLEISAGDLSWHILRVDARLFSGRVRVSFGDCMKAGGVQAAARAKLVAWFHQRGTLELGEIDEESK